MCISGFGSETGTALRYDRDFVAIGKRAALTMPMTPVLFVISRFLVEKSGVDLSGQLITRVSRQPLDFRVRIDDSSVLYQVDAVRVVFDPISKQISLVDRRALRGFRIHQKPRFTLNEPSQLLGGSVP